MVAPESARFESLSPFRKAVTVAVVLGLVIGLALAPIAYDLAAEPTVDRVAVVPIEGVLAGGNTQDVVERLIEARQDPSVKAVVLRINSPGGLAVDGEEIFQQVERTAQVKPVVASIGLQGTSAAYLAALPADEIYVRSSSSVGSVGAILIRPSPIDPIDVVVQTGPMKLVGDSPRGYEYRTETVGKTFAGLVLEYRTGKIELSSAELRHARVYTGVDGVELGLVDGVTDTQGAIQSAADLADLDRYEVQFFEYDTEVQFLDRAAYSHSTVDNKRMIGLDELVDTDGKEVVPTVVMLPRAVVKDIVDGDMVLVVNGSAEIEGEDHAGG